MRSHSAKDESRTTNLLAIVSAHGGTTDRGRHVHSTPSSLNNLKQAYRCWHGSFQAKAIRCPPFLRIDCNICEGGCISVPRSSEVEVGLRSFTRLVSFCFVVLVLTRNSINGEVERRTALRTASAHGHCRQREDESVRSRSGSVTPSQPSWADRTVSKNAATRSLRP
jgi:hypothetical protein